MANLAGCFSSGYPVCGSFSRSSLSATAGAKTPFCSVVTLFIVVIALGALTGSFFYIPQSALAGIIFVAVTNIIAPTEFVEAWIHNKNDFCTMLITFIVTFVFDTSLGLAAGIGVSVFMLLKDLVFSPDSKPFYEIVANMGTLDDGDLEKNGVGDGDGLNGNGNDEFGLSKDLTVQIVRLNNDLVFLTAPAIKDALVDEILNKRGNKFEALILDFSDVKIVDISGMIALKETMTHTRSKKIQFVLIHVRHNVHKKLEKFGVTSDSIIRQRICKKSAGDMYASIGRPSDKNFYSGITDEEQSLLRSLDHNDPLESSFSGIIPSVGYTAIQVGDLGQKDVKGINSLGDVMPLTPVVAGTGVVGYADNLPAMEEKNRAYEGLRSRSKDSEGRSDNSKELAL